MGKCIRERSVLLCCTGNRRVGVEYYWTLYPTRIVRRGAAHHSLSSAAVCVCVAPPCFEWERRCVRRRCRSRGGSARRSCFLHHQHSSAVCVCVCHVSYRPTAVVSRWTPVRPPF